MSTGKASDGRARRCNVGDGQSHGLRRKGEHVRRVVSKVKRPEPPKDVDPVPGRVLPVRLNVDTVRWEPAGEAATTVAFLAPDGSLWRVVAVDGQPGLQLMHVDRCDGRSVMHIRPLACNAVRFEAVKA